MNKQPFCLLAITLMSTMLLEPIALASSAAEVQSPSWLLAQSRSMATPARVTFNPPSRGAPPATFGLGSRGSCTADDDNLKTDDNALKAVVPTESERASDPSEALGLTIAAHPTIFVYLPEYYSLAQALSLRLMKVTEDDQETELYSQDFALPATSGIVGLQVDQPTRPPLEVGQRYHWYVSLVCDPIDRSGNAIVDGWIERIEPDAALSSQLEQSAPIDRAVLYGQTGIWHDTLLTLAELRRDQPDDSAIRETWKELLRSVGLEAIAEVSVLEYAQPLD
jgi:hypothetical protein